MESKEPFFFFVAKIDLGKSVKIIVLYWKPCAAEPQNFLIRGHPMVVFEALNHDQLHIFRPLFFGEKSWWNSPI